MTSSASLPEVRFDSKLWESDFAVNVLSLFASVERTIKEQRPPTSTAFEIEARLGLKSKEGFQPGVTKSFFGKMHAYWASVNSISKQQTETYDFSFAESGRRVTVDVTNKQVAPKVTEVLIKERLRKFPPLDYTVIGDAHHKLRIAIGLEHSLPLDGNESKLEREHALRQVKLMLQSQELYTLANWVLEGATMLVKDNAVVDGLEGLEWTLIRKPSNIGIEDFGWDTTVLLGNLPTGLTRPGGGSGSPCAAFEHQISVAFKDLELALDTAARSSKRAKPIEPLECVVRHKKRTKVAIPSRPFIIDFTETRDCGDGSWSEENGSDNAKFEVELERCVVTGELQGSLREGRMFICGVADTLFSMHRDKLGFNQDDNTIYQAVCKRLQAGIIKEFVPVASDGAVAEAENFYKGLKRNQGDRIASVIYHMRCLNNFVKSMLIQKYLPLDNKNNNKRIRVLELGCGKGADLAKLSTTIGKQLGLEYLGTDLAKQSLEQGIERIKDRIPHNHSYKLVAADLTRCDLSQSQWMTNGEQLDMWDSDSKQWSRQSKVNSIPMQFDFCTMQFAFHYMCKSRQCLNQFLRGVSAMLREGATFVCTTVDSDALLEELAQSPLENRVELKDEQGRLICQVDFPPEMVARMLRPLNLEKEEGEEGEGFKYQFKLFDGDSEEERAVDAPEYLVVLPLLRRLAEENGLELTLAKQRLGSFAQERFDESEANRQLWTRMNVSNVFGTMSPVEWRITNLYQILVFTKMSNFNIYQAELSRTTAGWADLDPSVRVQLTVDLLNLRRPRE
ncbi:hypothetical protein BASA81_004896 [Batrachochytrium salamandrivorans]|nr:hypothetical protein BASA81_004896 [Batrachochytrium salamandrivorans]